MADLNDFMARYRREEEKRTTSAAAALRYASGALRLMGVARVVAAFDGAGDSGAIESVRFDPPPPAGVPDGLAEVIENALYKLLPGGFEINEGSSGTITLDTATGRTKVDQQWNEPEEYGPEDEAEHSGEEDR